MYVTAELNGGLGNRFFQVAAMLGYAEKYGHTPVFVKDFIKPNKSHPGPNAIQDFFEKIPILDSFSDYETIHEQDGNAFTYVELPYFSKNVKLQGYFQSEKYFPSYKILPSIIGYTEQPFYPAIFMHVRRGDYLLEVTKHHRVDLKEYFRRALSSAMQPNMYVLVCSDDIEWCKNNLPLLYSEYVKNWVWFEGNDVETLRAMARCEYGGICANSTFSWWGAYFNNSLKKMVFMPGTWGYPPLPPARDIYPKNTFVLPT